MKSSHKRAHNRFEPRTPSSNHNRSKQLADTCSQLSLIIVILLSEERQPYPGNIVEAMADSSLNDDVDARGLFGKTKAADVAGSIIGSLESADYSLKYGKRGKCLIFNHKTFEPHTRLNDRNGTDADAARLYCRFKELGFEVTLHSDLKVDEIKKELSKAGKFDHSDYSCFVCCVLSHGEQGILYGADAQYKTEKVFENFRGDACPSLAGKPKIFFIQACQGDRLDCGVNVKCRVESSDYGEEKNTLRIPTHADFLIVYSTVPGFYSWRNTTNGSWFVQSLCAILNKHAYDFDLLQLLTMVNRRVAYDFESFTPHDSEMHLKKQVPCITSTLTKNLKFSPP